VIWFHTLIYSLTLLILFCFSHSTVLFGKFFGDCQ